MAPSESMPPPSTPSLKDHNVIPSSSPAFATPAHPIRIPLQVQPSAYVPLVNTNSGQRRDAPKYSNDEATRNIHILPISLPPATLRPIAFRAFTKKHNLTLTTSALTALASFVGKNCGQGWREEGLAELVLEEVARSWKKVDGRVIVDADEIEGTGSLKALLKALEVSMKGGRIVKSSSSGNSIGLTRQDSLLASIDRPGVDRNDSSETFGMSDLEVESQNNEDNEDDAQGGDQQDIREWLKLVNASEQPRMEYNVLRKQFERSKTSNSLFPAVSEKTNLFRQRYYLMHQRLMRIESFQAQTVTRAWDSNSYRTHQVTPIANLLGRNGSGHLLLGLLSISPAATLALSDLTGSIMLDLEQAMPFNDVDTYFCPGMIVLVDGIYEEEFNPAGGKLGNMGGIGGTLGGRFVGFSIGAPRCETRASTLGMSGGSNEDVGPVGGGFGWVDFLGVGSERALGSKMKRLEQRLLQESRIASTNRRKLVILGEVMLDSPKILSSLHKIFSKYANASDNEVPMAFVLMGSFISQAAMSSPASGSAATSAEKDSSSIAYKEHFDALANVLSEFPLLLRKSSFIFVPGDNDPWPSAALGGAAASIPRNGIPEIFTLRIRRAFAAANSGGQDNESRREMMGEALWASNPSRLTLFGSRQEIVFFRDNLSGRLRRTALRLKNQAQEAEHGNDISMGGVQTSEVHDDERAVPTEQARNSLSSAQTHARRLTKTLLDQSHLSPFPLATRPINWSQAHTLSLYPLPSALILCDAGAEAFALVYQGCCVINAGTLVNATGGVGGKIRASWIEYDSLCRRAIVKDIVD